jgi:hypothetical protein
MSDMSAPKSTITKESDLAQDRLKEQEKAKANAANFIMELFLFLLQNIALILKKQFDQLHTGLTEIAQRNGFSDLPSALNLAKNEKGQSPLVQALQNQDFAAARALHAFGAEYDDDARAEYDIAIHSQNGRQALEQNVITPPSSYSSSAPDKLHPVKAYGLVLGLEMTSVDGTPSQRAHVGPTYQLMTNSISDYSKSCKSEPAKGDFGQIADAFKFASKASGFQHSTPTGTPAAGAELCERIQAGKVTSVPISCKGHAMGLAFAPVEGDPNKTYLIFTNRGTGAGKDGHYGTRIYEVDKRDVTPEFLNSVMSGHDKGQSHDEIMKQMKQVTKGLPPVEKIDQAKQKYDNCTIANTKANTHGILLCLEANRKGGFAHVDKEQVKERYKEFTADMSRKTVQKLADEFSKDPQDKDLKTLMTKYIEKDGAHKDILEPLLDQHRESARVNPS